MKFRTLQTAIRHINGWNSEFTCRNGLEKWDLHAFKELFSNLVTETLFSSTFPKRLIFLRISMNTYLIYIVLSKQVQDMHVRENITINYAN